MPASPSSRCVWRCRVVRMGAAPAVFGNSVIEPHGIKIGDGIRMLIGARPGRRSVRRRAYSGSVCRRVGPPSSPGGGPHHNRPAYQSGRTRSRHNRYGRNLEIVHWRTGSRAGHRVNDFWDNTIRNSYTLNPLPHSQPKMTGYWVIDTIIRVSFINFISSP